MRLCTSTSLCLAAAALATLTSAGTATAGTATADTPAPCAAPDARTFPLTTRIHGGPRTYEAGGGYGTWYLDLTNTTRRTCTGIHPVVVLVDDQRALRPSQPQLDFYEGDRPHPVRFEGTDQQELVGVLDAAGFGGFTVPPGRTVTVRLRLSLTSEAVPDHVTVNAAVVQRRGQDGDWVGQSDDYRFDIAPDDGVQEPRPSQRSAKGLETAGKGNETATARDPARATSGAGAVPPAGTGQPDGTRTDPAASGSPHPVPTDGAASGADPSLPLTQEAAEAGERARELAGTGLGLAQGLLAAAAALLTVGGTAFLLARSRR